MIPPVTETLKASTAVTTIVGQKVFFGLAPEGTVAPYIAWNYVAATPDNNLSDTPDSDDVRIQVDCYVKVQSQGSALAIAARDALESVTHLVSGPTYFGQEDDTKLHRWFMEPYWILSR